MLSDDFIRMFPEFRETLFPKESTNMGFDSDLVSTYLPLIEGTYSCYYGADYDTGSKCDKTIILWLCAHLLSLRLKQVQDAEDTGSGSGAEIERGVASKSVDGVSESFITSSYDTVGELAFFSSTPYGLQFLALTRHRIGGVWV